MTKISIAIAALSLTLCSVPARSQISKQLEDRTKESQAAEKKSWEQVDQINNQTDQTNARLHQSRQNATQSINKSGSTVSKTRLGVASPYRKMKPRKPASNPKQPPHHPD